MTFPDRPIHLLLGASTGSARDILARALAPALSEQLRQPVIVDLHPGDNGEAAPRHVAGSPPDGHTLFMTAMGVHAIAPSMQPPPPYDVIKDFSAVSLLARCPLVLAVHPSVPVQSVDELTRHARQFPGTLTFASSSIGGAPHIAAELYMQLASVDMRLVCYDSTRRLFADLADGKISLSFNNVMSMLELLSTGKLRGLAVTSATRFARLPQLPTLAESGLDGYEMTNWLGLVAPANVDGQIIATLNAATQAALQTDRVKTTLDACGMEVAGSSPAAFARLIDCELEKWAPIAQKCGAQSPHAAG